MGYWLGESHWGKGIMSEAVKAIVNFGFGELGLERIEAGVFVGNDGSEKILLNLGFILEGVARRFVRAKSTGEYHDNKMFSLLRGEWKDG